VTTLNTAGHTPGHPSVHIGSGSEELLLAGDVVINSAVSCGAQLVVHAESPVTAFRIRPRGTFWHQRR
jgi:glyoxylase-like metal-dependent hydrolase (beta-lactamase superfamily II)